jgi:hypothetical protein
MTSSDRSNERVVQSELPLYTLRDALRIAKPILDEYGGHATSPVDLAMAVGIKPTSSSWRYLTGAAAGYGITQGAANSSRIGLTELGRRLVEGDDREAFREAALRPRILGGFLRKYDGHKFPREEIAKNVLMGEFGVPAKRVLGALAIIATNATDAGFFREIGGDRFVALGAVPSGRPTDGGVGATTDETEGTELDDVPEERDLRLPPVPEEVVVNRGVRGVFISHSKNRTILDQVKQMLELGDFVPEVAVEQETGAIPVPDKVFDAMRRCGAGIICVTADTEMADGDGSFRVNPNVLIEIGAAYVLYERRLILLWDRRVAVPSNLQGLYRCEYEGDELSWSAGTRLQKALLAFKKGEQPPKETER